MKPAGLTAAVIEVVSGMRWEDFLSERVLMPLGMTDSGFKPTEESAEVWNGGYEFRDVCAAAANRFFEHKVDDSGVNAHTGRL